MAVNLLKVLPSLIVSQVLVIVLFIIVITSIHKLKQKLNNVLAKEFFLVVKFVFGDFE